MAFRTIVIEKAARINLDLNNIVIRYNEENFWINLDEINNIIIDDPRCMVSLKLLCELCSKGINIILTNDSHMPIGTLQTLNNNVRSSKKILKQIKWDNKSKSYLWTKIVNQKIKSQIQTLKNTKKIEKIDIMVNCLNTIIKNDATNREGTASRTYFKSLFGKNFKRFNDDIINFSINYIYQVIRSKISQEIVTFGYIPSLGIWHSSEYNSFNLADDLIEPYRPIVDYFVYKTVENYKKSFLTPDLKKDLINIVNEIIIYDDRKMKLHTSIRFYVQNLLTFLEIGDVNKIKFPTLCKK